MKKLRDSHPQFADIGNRVRSFAIAEIKKVVGDNSEEGWAALADLSLNLSSDSMVRFTFARLGAEITKEKLTTEMLEMIAYGQQGLEDMVMAHLEAMIKGANKENLT